MTPPRRYSEAFVAFVKAGEGFRPTANLDPAGYGQIGYGHKLAPTDPLRTATLTTAGGEALLREDLDKNACYLCASIPCAFPNLTQGQFDALVDFVYNEGIGEFDHSHLRELVIAGKLDEVPAELDKWVFAGKPPRVMHGLEHRRAGEVSLWKRVEPA